jgi:ADP-ribose pyrophosphatase YjhB (NUDIX family)
MNSDNSIDRYVLGLLFSYDKKSVVLIEKKHPDKYKGMLTAVGGHALDDEKFQAQAMCRTFKKETGVSIDYDDWKFFLYMTGKGWNGYCFKCFSDTALTAKTTTDEKVKVYSVDDALRQTNLIPNLKWIIPFALDSYLSNDKYKVEGYF